MWRDDGEVTDGQESIPWATSLLLTTQLCQLHNPHPSHALLHCLHHHSSDIPFHLYCFTPSCCVITTSLSSIVLFLTSFQPLPPSLFLFLNFPCSNGRCAKLRPNSLIFLHVVTAQAVILLFLLPFQLCWSEAKCSDPGLPATCCNFTSWHVGTPH